MLGKHGLCYAADFEFVLAGAHPQRWGALQAGTIDAALQLLPFDMIAEDARYRIWDAPTIMFRSFRSRRFPLAQTGSRTMLVLRQE